MTGVILCGGQSSRMGTDKGMLPYEPITWAQLAADKLTALQLPVIVSVNEQQYSFYKSKLPQFDLILDNNNLGIGGPLKGIMSVHLQYPSEDLLVLACDMPAMQIEPLLHLLKVSQHQQADAFVYTTEQTVEPLCGIYTAKALQKVYNQYQQGVLKKHSLQFMIHNSNTFFIPLPNSWKSSFNNYNTPTDLNNL